MSHRTSFGDALTISKLPVYCSNINYVQPVPPVLILRRKQLLKDFLSTTAQYWFYVRTVGPIATDCCRENVTDLICRMPMMTCLLYLPVRASFGWFTAFVTVLTYPMNVSIVAGYR